MTVTTSAQPALWSTTMPPSIFIPSEKLGILEPLIREYCAIQTKRARTMKLREVAGLLPKVKLIPEDCRVVALGLGCNVNGEHGALILVEPTTTTRPAGPVGEESHS